MAIQSRMRGSPADRILVSARLVMLGGTRGSGMTVTGTANSVLPAMFCVKQLYQPAEEAVILHIVSVYAV